MYYPRGVHSVDPAIVEQGVLCETWHGGMIAGIRIYDSWRWDIRMLLLIYVLMGDVCDDPDENGDWDGCYTDVGNVQIQ